MRRIFVLLVLFAAAASAQTVSVGGAGAQCGGSANVPVSISNVSGLLALEFHVAYDSSRVTPTGVSAAGLTSSFSTASNATGGVLRVAMASGTPVSGSGSVAIIAFSVAANASGSVPLTISNVLVNDVPAQGVSGTIDVNCARPPDPPSLVAPNNGETNVAAPVTLQWSAAADATLYRVFFGTTPQPPFRGETTGTSMQVTTESATRYYWQVQALGTGGAASSEVASFTTAGPTCATPAAPQNVTAPQEVNTGARFAVSWDGVAGATSYVVEVSTSGAFVGATATTVQPPATSVELTANDAETTLHVRVRARIVAPPCDVDGPTSSPLVIRVVRRRALPHGTTIIPVAGATEGSFGSFFRTSMQLHNPTTTAMRGRIVFHRQGIEGSDSDPSLAYALAASETISFADVLAAIGAPRGIGSLDIVAESSTAPLAVVRVFNDAGAAGTAGMMLEPLSLDDALQAGRRGILLAPMDPSRARMNIGIRTLLDGATMTITVRDKRGAMIHSVRRAYPPTFFVQSSLADLAAATLLGDEVVHIDVESGSAIVYGSTTDNTTQDPSVQIARVQ